MYAGGGNENRTNKKFLSWMHFVCRLIYWFGLGDCWHESRISSAMHKVTYAFYSFLMNAFVIILICSEVAALLKTNLSDKDKNEVIQFSFAHPLIVSKWLFIVIHKRKIKELLKKLLVTTREVFANESIDRNQLRRSKQYCFGLAATMYFAIFSTTIDCVIEYYKTGTPWRSLVTFYPEREDSSWTAYAVRVTTTYFWVHIVTCMLATDFLAVNCLILIAFKFKTLQLYFKGLKTNMETNPLQRSQTELENDMHQGFVRGIFFHNEILWCARNTQKSLGKVYSIQVLQTMSIFIICLVKLVTSKHNMSYLFASFSVITCLLFLTGFYMWNAGEITYEASLVSDAMFQSGWHLCSARARMRKLLVVGIARSQVPVVMTAFGVVDLSYENFLKSAYNQPVCGDQFIWRTKYIKSSFCNKIVKNSYSVFAVLY